MKKKLKQSSFSLFQALLVVSPTLFKEWYNFPFIEFKQNLFSLFQITKKILWTDIFLHIYF